MWRDHLAHEPREGSPPCFVLSRFLLPHPQDFPWTVTLSEIADLIRENIPKETDQQRLLYEFVHFFLQENDPLLSLQESCSHLAKLLCVMQEKTQPLSAIGNKKFNPILLQNIAFFMYETYRCPWDLFTNIVRNHDKLDKQKHTQVENFIRSCNLIPQVQTTQLCEYLNWSPASHIEQFKKIEFWFKIVFLWNYSEKRNLKEHDFLYHKPDFVKRWF